MSQFSFNLNDRETRSPHEEPEGLCIYYYVLKTKLLPSAISAADLALGCGYKFRITLQRILSVVNQPRDRIVLPQLIELLWPTCRTP